MATNTGLAALFDPSYQTGDPELDALFGLTGQPVEELPPLRYPERGEIAGGEEPKAARQRGEPVALGGKPTPYDDLIYQKATAAGQDPNLIKAQIWAESSFNPKAVSHAGAQGLTQFMPGTWNKYGRGSPFDPNAAIDAQIAYNADLLQRFGGDERKVLAAYNWGEHRKSYALPDWERHAPAETRDYVKKILAKREEYARGQPQRVSSPDLIVSQTPQALRKTQQQQESPYYPVRLSDGQVFDVEKGMGLDEVATMLQQNNINAKPLRPYVTPDGQEFDVEYDMTDDEIQNMLKGQKPVAPEESNYLGALKYGAQQAVSGIAQGAGTEIGELGKAVEGFSPTIGGYLQEKGPQLHAYGEQLGKDIEGTYERPKGLGFVEENVTYPLAETVGGVAPYAGAFMVPGVGTALGTAAIHAGSMGELESRAEAQGKEFVPSEARPYAVLDDVANMIGLNATNKLLKAFGQDAILGSREAIKAAVEKGNIEEAKKVVGSRIGNIAKQFLGAEAGTIGGEVVEDVIGRAYTDQPLIGEDAFNEYWETTKQMAPLGGVTGLGRGFTEHYNKATEFARLEEQAAVEEALQEQDAQRQKIEELATIGVTPEQLQKYGVRNELEGLSDEELLESFKADLAEKEAAKAARLAELPEELRDIPYREAKRYQQMLAEQEAGVPSEEAIEPVEEPVTPVEEPIAPVEEPVAPVDLSGVTPPPAVEIAPEAVQAEPEVAEEIPEPTIRGKAPKLPEAVAPEVTNPADILGLNNRSGLRKQLQGFDINNVEDHPKIEGILQKTSATFSAENLANLENKMKEVQSANGIQIPAAPDVSSVAQPEIRQEGQGAPVSSEGVRGGGQEIGAVKIPESKIPEAETVAAPELETPIAPEIPQVEQKIPSVAQEVKAPVAVEKLQTPAEAWDSLRAPEQPAFESLSKDTQKLWKDKYKASEGIVDKSAVDDLVKAEAEQPAKVKAPEVKAIEKPLAPERELTPLQARAKFGKDIGAVVGAGGHYLRGRVNKKAASAIESGDTKGTIAALKESKNPVVRWVAEKADLIDGLKVKTDEEAQETKLSKALFANEALKYRLGVLDALRNFRNKHADIGENGRIPYEETRARIFKKEDFDPNGYFAEAENTSLHGALNTELRGRETVLSVKLKDLDEAIANIENDFTSSGRSEEESRQAAGLLPRSIRAVGGAYDRESNTVKLDPLYAKDEAVIAHELTHAVVSHAIDRPTPKQRPAVHGLKKLHEAVKDHASIKEEYGVTNIHEFVSEGLSNPDFQQKLSKIKYESTTAWGKFTDSIANLLGLKKDNAFMELLALSEQLVPSKTTKPEGKGEFPSLQKTSTPEVERTAPLVKETEVEGPTEAELKEAEKRLKASGLVGAVKDKTFGDKFKGVINDLFKEGRNTSFVAEYVDIREPISKAVQDLPDNVGQKLRSDYIYSAYEQRGNVIQESYRKGFVAMGRDGTIETVADKQLALAEIFKRVGAKNHNLFNNVLVALRVRTIRAQDAETRAQANKLLNMADEMEDFASTLKNPAKRKKFNSAARNLRTVAERKLEGINWDKGRTAFTDQEVKDAETVLAGHPELVNEAENVYALLRKQVDLWENEGMIDKATADDWRKYPNYFPLYKTEKYDEQLANPSAHLDSYGAMMGKNPDKLPKVHRQEWHEHKVFVEDNLLRHITFFASAAAEHSARKNTAYNLEMVGKAERVKKDAWGDKDLIVKFRENGKDVFYRVDDVPSYYAMQSAMPLMSPLLKRMRQAGNFGRGVMIKNPLFWFRQSIREPIQASLVGRAGFISPFDTLNAVSRIASGSAKGYERLRAKGVIGPVDVIPDPAEFIKAVQDGKGLVAKGMDGINHVHEAMDAATRVVVYEKAKKDALSKGYDEDTADAIGVMKAREIINFAKQGRSKTVRAIRATTPFFGAALNSLDVMARAAFPRKVGHLSKAEAMEARRNFYSTAFMLATFTTAYAAMMSEDEDYLKEPDRVGNWLIPIGGGKFIKIPIPFEAGWFIKELPELAMLLNLGAINKKEAITEGAKGATANVLPPMPTAYVLQPIMEVAVDHDFFTGSSIEGKDSDVMVRDRNSKASKLMSEVVNKMEDMGVNVLGVSANQLEHLARKYLGQLWAVTRVASDAYINRGKVTPEKEAGEYPLVSGVLTTGTKDRAVNQFYTVAKEASQVNQSLEEAGKKGDAERFNQIVKNPENVKALKGSDEMKKLKEEIGEISTGIKRIENDQTLSSSEMTSRIKTLKARQTLLAKRGVEVARKLGMEI